jgi:hypothetical protein
MRLRHPVVAAWCRDDLNSDMVQLRTRLPGCGKAAFVIPNPRRLRVRDLVFAKWTRKKQIPHPVKNQTGFGNDIFSLFPHPPRTTADSFS